MMLPRPAMITASHYARESENIGKGSMNVAVNEKKIFYFYAPLTTIRSF